MRILCRSDPLRNSCRLATQRRRCRSLFRTMCTHRCLKTSPLRTEEQYTRLHFGILPVKFDPPCRQRNQWTQSQACRRPRRGTCSLRSSCRRTESSRRCTSPMGTHHTHQHQPMRSYPRRNRRSLAPEPQSFQVQTCHVRRGRTLLEPEKAGRFRDRTERIQGLQTPRLRCCLRACLPRTTSTCCAEWIPCRSDRLRNSCRLVNRRRRCRCQFRNLCIHRCPRTSPLRMEERYTSLRFAILPVTFDPPCRRRN